VISGLLGETSPPYAGAGQAQPAPQRQGLLGGLFGGAVTPPYAGGGQQPPSSGSGGWWGCDGPAYQPAPPPPPPEPPPEPPVPSEPPPEPEAPEEPEHGLVPVRIIVLEGDTRSRAGLERVLQRLQDYLLDQ